MKHLSKAVFSALPLLLLVPTAAEASTPASSHLPSSTITTGPPGSQQDRPQVLTESEYAEALAHLQAKFPWAFTEHPDRAGSVAGPWAKKLADAVFKGAAQSGFDAWLVAAFGNADAHTLQQINASLDDIKGQLADIEAAIARMEKSLAQTQFIAAEGHAKTYATHITSQFKLIGGWRDGHAYDAADVQHLVNLTYTAVEQLNAHLLGPYGAQTLLTGLLAHSPRDTAFRQMDEYRMGYRGHLATALLNLEWAHEQDPKHLNQLQIANQTARATEAALLDVGLRVDNLTPLRSSTIQRTDRTWHGITRIYGDGMWSGVRFNVGSDLPPVLTRGSRLHMHYHVNTYDWYSIDFSGISLTADTFSGQLSGQAHGSIRSNFEGAPDRQWTFSASVTGNIGNDGRMTLSIPMQQTGGGSHFPFRHINLVLNPA